jgi:hypothetical protein
LFEHDLFGKPVSTFPDHALMVRSGWMAYYSVRGEILLLARKGAITDRRPRRLQLLSRAASPVKEGPMYAAIRQGKAKPGMVEELARRIKEGAIPIISDVEGFMAYYVVYAPDDTVTAISIFNQYAQAAEANQRVLAWIEQDLAPLLVGPATAVAGPVIVHTLA